VVTRSVLPAGIRAGRDNQQGFLEPFGEISFTKDAREEPVWS
jgi:hypothetical protein